MEWDARNGTNPDTCLHRVITATVVQRAGFDYHIFFCVSCNSTLDVEFLCEYNWAYDIDHNVWHRTKPPKGDIRIYDGSVWRRVDELRVRKFNGRKWIEIDGEELARAWKNRVRPGIWIETPDRSRVERPQARGDSED